VSQKSTTSPQRAGGVLFLYKEEKVKVLIIKYFPSFPMRGVPTVVSGWGGWKHV